MALHKQLKKRSITSGKQTSYKQNVVAVNTLVTSVLSSSLPP